MQNLLRKIWYINEKNRLSATLTYTAEMSYVTRDKIPFGQQLQIQNHLREDLFVQMYGHMPQTCRTIIKHIKRCEKEMRELGENMLANKLGSSAALVESLLDQMTAPGIKSAPPVTQEDECPNIIHIEQ